MSFLTVKLDAIEMIWFYMWCGLLGFIVLSVPIAALLENRGSGSEKPPANDDEEVIEEGEMVDEAEEAEFVEEFSAEGDEIIEIAEEV